PERTRDHSAPTRTARLAAVHPFSGYAALPDPEHAGLIARVLAIPEKRSGTSDVCFLTEAEVTALLAAPDRSIWIGRRDHALLLLDIQTGLRLSELIGLTRTDLEFGTSPHVGCRGKGRKSRITPLTKQTV